MELLAYCLSLFGLFMIIKGAKPTIEWISNNTDKELLKGIGFVAVILTIGFYIIAIIHYLEDF
jgi:uncharacterized membrane protein HdeD (DUF308 family)